MDLDQLDDRTLVSKVKETADAQAFDLLLQKHSGVFYKTIYDYMPPSFNETDKRLILEEKPTFFFEAISSYNEEKNVEFITWLVNKTKFSLLTKRSEESKKPKFCELPNGFDNFSALHTVYEDDFWDLRKTELDFSYTDNFYGLNHGEIHDIAKMVGRKFGEQMKSIFLDRYLGNNGSGESFSEIGKKYSLSHQSVKVKHSKIIKYLKTVVKK